MNVTELIAAMRGTADAKPRKVDIKAWGGAVYARALTVDEVEEQTADTTAQGDKGRMARAAARVICDAQGKRLFDPGNAEHVKLLGAQPWALLRKVLEASEVDVPGN